MSGTKHSITCPNCNETVFVKRSVRQARMKCNHCGAMFVGSTRDKPQAMQPASPQAAPQAAPPQATPKPVSLGAPQAASRPHARQRTHLQKKREMHIRRKTPWAGIIICCFFVLGLIGAGVALFSKADAVGHDVAAAEAAKQARAMPRKPVAIPASAPLPLSEEAALPSDLKGEGANPSEPTSVTTKNCVQIPGEAEELLILVGDYKNVSSHVLASVQISVLIKGKAGKMSELKSPAYKLVPPGVTGTFSVQAPSEWTATSEMEIVRITPQYSPASAMLTGWSLKDPAVTSDTEGGRRVFARGDIKNETKSYLRNPQVVVDFFTDEEIYVGSAMGRFHGAGKVIRPGMQFSYTAELDASKIEYALSLITKVKVRFVATQSQ
jgi:hypothetical protein